MRKEKFGVCINTMPGFSAVGKFFNREDVVSRFNTKMEADSTALKRAEFGAPFNNQFAACVTKFVPGKGWKAVSQHDCEVWE